MWSAIEVEGVLKNIPGVKENNIKASASIDIGSDPFGKRLLLRLVKGKDAIHHTITDREMDVTGDMRRHVTEIGTNLLSRLVTEDATPENPYGTRGIPSGDRDDAEDAGKYGYGYIPTEEPEQENEQEDPVEDPLRATGRTSRALLNALFLLSKGDNTVVVCRNHYAAEAVAATAAHMAKDMGWPVTSTRDSVTLGSNGNTLIFAAEARYRERVYVNYKVIKDLDA